MSHRDKKRCNRNYISWCIYFTCLYILYCLCIECIHTYCLFVRVLVEIIHLYWRNTNTNSSLAVRSGGSGRLLVSWRTRHQHADAARMTRCPSLHNRGVGADVLTETSHLISSVQLLSDGILKLILFKTREAICQWVVQSRNCLHLKNFLRVRASVLHLDTDCKLQHSFQFKCLH